MSDEEKAATRLDIGNALFLDIVGYSRQLIEEQRDCLHQLNKIVRATESFREADAAGTLTMLPTGDGMALVFNSRPDAPVKCAMEIARR